MRLNNILLPSLVILLISISVLAQEGGTEEPQQYDYQNSESYQNADFYQHSDPSQWEWSKVNWDLVDFTRADMYGQQAFYQNLPADRYSALNYQLVNYAVIDQSKIDSNKWLLDWGCAGCSIENAGQLRYNGASINHAKGDFVVATGYPTGTKFVAQTDRILVVLPHDSEISEAALKKMSNEQFSLDSRHDDIKLPNGVVINFGQVSFAGGKAFMKKDDSAVINNLHISAFGSKTDINLFFDGELHPESTLSYVSLDTNKRQIAIGNIEGGRPEVRFEEGNPFIRIDRQDFLRLDFKTDKSSQVIIRNRDKEGLIPEVIVRADLDPSDKRPVVEILDGGVVLSVGGDLLGKPGRLDESVRSTPLAIRIQSTQANRFYDTQKILISNFNEIAQVPIDKSESVIDFENPAGIALRADRIPGKFRLSETLYYNYNPISKEQFEAQTGVKLLTQDPNSKIEIRESEYDPETVRMLYDQYNALPPSIRKSVNAIIIYPSKTFTVARQEIGFQEGINGWTTTDGIIRLDEKQITTLLSHEAAHDYTYAVENDHLTAAGAIYYDRYMAYVNAHKDELEQKAQSRGLSFDRYVASTADPEIFGEIRGAFSEKEQVSILEIANEYGQEQARASFETQWKSAAGDIYGRDLEETAGASKFSWSDGTDGPRKGCVRAYGCNNYREDVATYSENLNNPEFFKPLITPGSPQYDDRYVKKVEMLHRYRFMTDKQYNAILQQVK